MSTLRTLTLTLTLLLLTVPALAADAEECDLRATIVDGNQQPVSDAVLHLLDADVELTSDGAGVVCAPRVPDGRQTLLVIAAGFSVLDATVTKETDAPLLLELELTPAFGEEIVVTGTRTAKRLAETPVHVQRISRDSIEASASRTLADAIELTPGVRIESNCQNCNFSQVRMLGLEGPYSQILVDGQPTVSSLALVYGVEQFPASALENIEVVKGGGAAIYGAGAVGGVINLIPHSPLDTHFALDARGLRTGGEAGYSLSAMADWSPRQRRTGFSFIAQLDEVDPADLDGDGFTEVTSRELTTFGVRGEHYLLADQARLSGELNFTDARRRGGDLVRFDRRPDETALTEEISTERLGLSLGFLHTVSARFDYRLAGSYADTSRDSYYGGGFDPNAYGTTENPLWILDSQANLYHSRGTYSFGASYSRDEIDDRQPGYDRLLQESNSNLGVYVQDDRTLGDKVTVIYGLRADDHSALPDPVLLPRLAAMLAPRDDVTVRLSYAQGFRAPVTFDEDLHIELAGGEAQVIRPAADLVEERSDAYLLSVEWRPTFGRKGSAALEVAGFRTDLEDLFDVIEADDPATDQREFLRVNAAGAQVEGVELAASLRWGSRLSLQAGYVVQSSRLAEAEPDFGSRELFRSPDQYGTFLLQSRLPAAIELFLGARYTGEMTAPHYAGFITEDRLERTPSFVELDLNLSRDFRLAGRSVTLTVGAKNLTDEYQEDLDRGPDRDSNYVYGPRLPRSYQVGLRWQF
ncbi:MAG: TonB-dependent receptor [Acidobacteriota bacterium]